MNDHRLLFAARCCDVGNETIAALRHCLNVVLAFLTLSERLAEYRDVLREVVLLDKTVRPHQLHQLFFRQHVTGVFEQSKQRIEDFRRERHFAILFEEKSLSWINPKPVKQIEAFTPVGSSWLS